MSDQMPLIEAESDEALLLPREELAKRYTGKTAEKIESRRDCIVALLGCGLSVEYIAQVAHCSTRTVRSLGGRYATAAARSTEEMCRVLGSLAMKAAFHLDQKMDMAKPGELGVVMGIALQRKQEMELGSAGALAGETALETVEESEARKEFKARLALLAAPVAEVKA